MMIKRKREKEWIDYLTGYTVVRLLDAELADGE